MANSASTSAADAETAKKVAMNPKAVWELSRDSVSAWIDDFAPSMGAAISYYTVFSIAPLLLIVIAVAGIVLGHDAASGKIFRELNGFLGPEGASAIQGMVKSASSPAKSTLGTIIGIVTLLIGATTVFAELQSALDRIWRAPAAAKNEGIWNLIRSRFLSLGLIMAIGFLLLTSLIVTAGLSALGEWWAPFFGAWAVVLQIVNFVVSIVIVTALFAMIYKWLPRARVAWHDVIIGAVVTAVLFTIGKAAISLYIGKSGVASGFGAAGSLVVLLLWVYYSSQIFLLGAEFTWHYAYRFGSRRNEAPAAATAPAKSEPDTLVDGPEATRAKALTAKGRTAVRTPAERGPSSLLLAAGLAGAVATGAAIERVTRQRHVVKAMRRATRRRRLWRW